MTRVRERIPDVNSALLPVGNEEDPVHFDIEGAVSVVGAGAGVVAVADGH